MKFTEGFPLPLNSHRFVAERYRRDSSYLPQALIAIAQILAEWWEEPPLIYAGEPPIEIELSQGEIEAYIKWLTNLRDSGIPKAFCFSSAQWNPKLTLYIASYNWLETEAVWVLLPSKGEKFLELNRCMQAVLTACQEFDSRIGFIEDGQIKQMYESSALGSTLDLLPISQFNAELVPDKLWWINFWSYEIVHNVGLQNIRNAPWARMLELPKGIIAAVTEDPTNPEKPDHLRRLQQIIQSLKLREAQERFLFSK
jgi:hypothetical protein